MTGGPRAELRERLMSARRARTLNRARRASAPSTSRVLIVAIILMLAIVGQRSGRAADITDDALPFSLSYTVTGDYAVGSVDLLPSAQTEGFQTGTIRIGTGTEPGRVVPKNAEILAAFLYWETLSETVAGTEGVLFNGQPVSFVRTAARTLDGVFAPCWSRSGNTLFAQRADVLSLLPIQFD